MGHGNDEVGRLPGALALEAQAGLEKFLVFLVTAVLVLNGASLLAGMKDCGRSIHHFKFHFFSQLGPLAHLSAQIAVQLTGSTCNDL